MALGGALVLAMTACAEGAADPQLDPSAAQAALTWEEFRRGVYQEPDTGLFIVDGDVPLRSEEELRKFYDRLVATPAAQTPEAEFSTSRAPLIISRTGSLDNRWPEGLPLTYCVSTSFGGNYGAVVAAMNQAASEWNSTSNINFSHRSDLDGSCDASTPGVVFDVRPTSGAPYIARAFFPDDLRRDRNVLIDTRYLPTGTRSWSLAGVMRHELGHALGFLHEHVRPEARATTCFESGSNYRSLTPYDSASVMHYPQCNGTNRGDLTITALDAAGAVAAYGPRPPAGLDPSFWTWRWPFGSSNNWSSFEVIRGDFNADQRADLYLHGRPGSGVGDYMGLSAGPAVPGATPSAFEFWTWTWPFGSNNWNSFEVLTGDFNGDRRTDIYLHGRPGSGAGDYMGLSTGTGFEVWTWSWPYGASVNWNAFQVITADFDGDGRTDLYLHGRPGSGFGDYMGLSTGRGFEFWTWAWPFGAGVNWNAFEVSTSDFDGDGRSDLFLHGRPGSGQGDYMALSTGRGFEFWTWAWPFGAGANWNAFEVVTGDFNGDRRGDLYLHGRPGTGQGDYMAHSTGRGFVFWTWAWPFGPGANWNAFEALTADLDGDRRSDLYLHARPGSGDPDYAGVSTGSGFTFWNWTSTFSPGREVSLSDSDGDGRADLYLHAGPGVPYGDFMRSPLLRP
jgi:hypothetical protein